MAKATPAPAAPNSTELVVQVPAAVTVAAPDVTALVQRYNSIILPLWRKYQDRTIATAQDYTQWNLDWKTFTDFSADIEALFDAPCKEAYDAHRTLTGMRGYIKSFPDQGAAYIGAELMRWKKEQERLRVLEEQRRQEQARLDAIAEQKRLQAIADADRAAAEAARQAVLADKDPWDVDEAELPSVPEAVVIELPPPAPVRLPSSVPTVIGGPRMVDKPWSCKITDPVALLRWVLESPEERLKYVEFNMPELNKKCRELGADTAKVIAGVEAVRDQTLKRS